MATTARRAADDALHARVLSHLTQLARLPRLSECAARGSRFAAGALLSDPRLARRSSGAAERGLLRLGALTLLLLPCIWMAGAAFTPTLERLAHPLSL